MRRWIALGTLALGLGCTPAEPERPNLLLVTVDTLRADRLSCYGGPAGSGDGLCGVFGGGLRYRWAFSTAPYTSPSIASLLSSRYPAYHGVTQAAASYLADPVTTVAESLREAGYATAAFVSNPVLDKHRNFAQGFDVYDQRMSRRERNRNVAERLARATTETALAWIEAGPPEPWFAWVHFQDPHGPYDPPAAPPAVDPPGGHRLPLLEDQSGHGGIPAYQALPGATTAEAYERRYLDEIAYLDPHLVRLVEGFDAASRLRPAVLLTADHGEALGEDDYWFAHGHSLGLDQIHVPLLYRPGASADARAAGASRVVETPVSLIDVAPSLLFLAGVPTPQGYQGHPLPGIGPEDPPPLRPLFAEHGRQAAVVKEGRFYARDRELEGARSRELGDGLPWLPPRSASLPPEDRPPRYQPVDPATEPLEHPLAAFLARTRDRKGVRHEEVPNEMVERMRALGYVEEDPE